MKLFNLRLNKRKFDLVREGLSTIHSDYEGCSSRQNDVEDSKKLFQELSKVEPDPIDWKLKCMQLIHILGDTSVSFEDDWSKYGISEEEQTILVTEYDIYYDKIILPKEKEKYGTGET